MSNKPLSKATMIKHIRELNKSIKDQYVKKNLPKLSRDQLEKAFKKRFQEDMTPSGRKYYKPKGIYAETPSVLSDAEWTKISPHKEPVKEKKKFKFKVKPKKEEEKKPDPPKSGEKFKFKVKGKKEEEKAEPKKKKIRIKRKKTTQ
jgi:hypothetical protein|tara:strand:+ start:937 stop:1374 length:438 start_codon:yes stop_codon:yes gene_type:complete